MEVRIQVRRVSWRTGEFKVDVTEWMGQSTPGCSLLLAPPYLKLVTKLQSHLTRQNPETQRQAIKDQGLAVGAGERGFEGRKGKESANSPSPPPRLKGLA